MTNLNKKIILAIPSDVKLYQCFTDNLHKLGFEVYLLKTIEKYKYKNLFERVKNIIWKIAFGNKQYKKTLVLNHQSELTLKQLETFPKTYYSLTIRVDLFNETVIKKIKELSFNNYAYQWDGLSRFKEAIPLISLFDKFYVFDKNDLNQKDLTYPNTNFYFDCYDALFENKAVEYDVFYIGAYDKRIEKLIPICEVLSSKGYILKIILCCSPKKELKKYPYITFIKERLSYHENLQMVAKCKCIIDLKHETLHSGLSLRTFDALGHNKKLITTNSIVKNYDFYNDKNIFILNEKCDYNEIDTFLNSNYTAIDPMIKYKYSFTNWLKYTLEIKGNIPINIP
jgi:hypothetical protein